MDVALFLIFAAIAVICAINLVVQTHPISSALSLIGVMASLAVLYLLLGAEFIAAAQIIVYAGAVMVLFVFVIMLLNTGAEKGAAHGHGHAVAQRLGIGLLMIFLGSVSYVIQTGMQGQESVTFGGFQGGTARDIGRALFTEYLLPFEITSILILIAILGAVVLAKKELD